MSFTILIPVKWPLRNNACVVISRAKQHGAVLAEAFVLSDQPLRAHLYSAFEKQDELIGVEGIARAWAIGELEDDLWKWHKSLPTGSPYPERVELVEEAKFLVRAWLRNVHRETIEGIRKATQDHDLRAYISQIQQLPEINSQNLS
jgi:hypothetical protein